MFDKFYSFDAEKMAEMFKAPDMTKFFENAKMPMFDMEAVATAQHKNMEALIEANKAAAAGYQEVFKAQVALFEDTMSSLQTQLSEMKMDQLSPEGAARQAELIKAGFEKALESLAQLTETATKANTEAFEIVAARVKASIEEIKTMAEKATA